MLQNAEVLATTEILAPFFVDRPQPDTPDVSAMIDLYRNEAATTYKDLAPNDPVAAACIDDYFAHVAVDLSEDITYSGLPYWVVRYSEDKQVVGMAGYDIDEELIHSVYMSSAHRGRGLGKMLLGHLLREIPHPQPKLMVATGNVSSVAFYQKLGFTFTGQTREWIVSKTRTLPEAEMQAPLRR